MAEITAASQKQFSGIEQVNQAITQMDEVTQQNAALVEEAAAAAESMQEQAGTLVQSVGTFRLAGSASTERAFEKAQDRRRPQRAVNVSRLPAKPVAKPAATSAGNAPQARKVAGGNDDWQEF
jgi:methyl-accepting chemotaxis protein